jgi:hypothetical protein
MKKALGILLLLSSSLILTGGAIAHPHHPDSIYHQAAHSHSGIEYLVIFTLLCLIGLIIAINKNK